MAEPGLDPAGDRRADASGAALGVKRSRYYTARRESYFFDYVRQELIDKYGVDTRAPRRPEDLHDDRPRRMQKAREAIGAA